MICELRGKSLYYGDSVSEIQEFAIQYMKLLPTRSIICSSSTHDQSEIDGWEVEY